MYTLNGSWRTLRNMYSGSASLPLIRSCLIIVHE